MQRMWWLNFIRGIVALIVGIIILLAGLLGGSLFVNFLAVFWLTSGVISLQWGLSVHQRKGLWLVAGIVGIVVGVALLLRFVYQRYLDPAQAVRNPGCVSVICGADQTFSGGSGPQK